MKFLKGILIAIQFFTAIPMKKNLPMDRPHIEKSIQAFPIVGFLQGIIYASLIYILSEWSPFSPLAIAFLVCLTTIIITGGLHIDGWMDMSDAYFSYQDKERRLEIMQDSRVGAFGVISVIILLSTRFLFIYEIIQFQHYYVFLFIACIPFFSKMVMGMILLHVPAAKKDGLAAFFKQSARKQTLAIYPIYLFIFLVVIFYIDKSLFIPISLMLMIMFGCYFFIKRKTVQHFGGITGDIAGASVEGCENILWMTLWLLHYFVMV